MKTVMKKIFSLILVAVLLVSAVPTAFAADGEVTCPNGHAAVYSRDYTAATCTEDQVVVYKCTKETAEECVWVGEFYYTVPNSKVNHTPGAEATCTAPQTCTVCGTTIVAAKEHTPGDAATCITAQTCTVCGVEIAPVDANNHAYDNGVCTRCGFCEKCNAKPCICCDKCSGTTTNHAADCPTLACASCGAPAHDGPCCSECGKYGHKVTACPELFETCCNVAKGTAHRADCVTNCTGKRDCTNGNHNADCLHELCDMEGCTLKDGHTGEHSGVPCSDKNCDYALNHTGKHSYLCPESACNLPVNHGGLHSFEHESEAGDSDLEIWVNLHTANVETKTRLLVTYEDLSEDTLIYEFISDRRDEIDDMLINYYGKDYEWSGHVYDSVKADTAVKTTAKLGEGTAVYINAYTYQDLVYVYVHDTRSYNNLRVILFEGKQIGDTISRAEIVDVVNDYYNLSSLRMYSEDDWKKVVQGKSVDARDNLKVTEEPFHIDVLISGTATAGSGYTADSSNPKTGDMIMTPAIIMCASISALATLFYLNKKRAI